MREAIWVRTAVVRAVHSRLLAEHGGIPGVRDPGLLESALAHPRNVWHNEVSPAVPRAAAAYGYALSANHAFIDGNKRVALVVLLLFLDLNGWRLEASEEETYTLTLGLAAGDTDERTLSQWLEQRSQPKS